MIRELCTTAFNKPQAGSPRTLLTSLQRAYSYNYSSSSASNFGMHNIYFVDFHNPRLMEVFCLHNNYQPTPISPKTSEWGRYLPKLIIIRHRGKNNHTLHAGAPEIIFFFLHYLQLYSISLMKITERWLYMVKLLQILTDVSVNTCLFLQEFYTEFRQ